MRWASCRPAPRPRPAAGGRGAAASATLAVLLLAAAGGCGVYSTRPGQLPAHVQRIAIPTFENRTVEAGLDQEVTQAVVDRFVADNHLKVVGESEADALLSGSVMEYKNVVFGFTGQVQAQEYRVSVTVAVKLLDKVKNRELWRDDALTRAHNYYVVDVPGDSAQDERTGRVLAIKKIADEILARTIENW
jgi:hypothetical protein